MSHCAISVNAISKRYRLTRQRERYRLLRDQIAQFGRVALRRAEKRAAQPSAEAFWALDDVSFNVQAGEVLGIIGPNGAGKSTLLKVLSRITEPTSGTVDLAGRIASLLEVGTGFHPELTGRENVYLNGAILGMRRHEIDRKFDQIVDFAEVEKFVDTPVKHFSSGMYLRLAFAVAAHLEPEILLIDEVLAVGDLAFQKKCLGKMEQVAKDGRTVLFVSHNLSAVQQLCSAALLLERGRVRRIGTPAECISEYALLCSDVKEESVQNLSSPIRINRIRVGTGDDDEITPGDSFSVSVSLSARGIGDTYIFFVLQDATGQNLIHNRILSREMFGRPLDGTYTIRTDVPSLWLAPGVYSAFYKFLPAIASNGDAKYESPRTVIEVKRSRGAADSLQTSGKANMVLAPELIWHLDALGPSSDSSVSLAAAYPC